MLTLPQIINRTAQRYIAVRFPVSIPFGGDMDPAFDELFSAFGRAGVEPNGMEFIKFNLIDMPRLEIEVGMTTDVAMPTTGRLVEGELPAGRYVSLTYTGPYADLMDVTAMLVGWAKEKGLKWDSHPTPEGKNSRVVSRFMTTTLLSNLTQPSSGLRCSSNWPTKPAKTHYIHDSSEIEEWRCRKSCLLALWHC